MDEYPVLFAEISLHIKDIIRLITSVVVSYPVLLHISSGVELPPISNSVVRYSLSL